MTLPSMFFFIQGIFHYGCQLLDAALAFRLSCKLDSVSNRGLMTSLNDNWKYLDTVSQEQMTRLRVSAVFHRTMEEQCLQLKDLKNLVDAIGEIRDKEQKKFRLRMHLHSREQLILEIGRMVRLGRLLKSRLKDPLTNGDTASR